MAKTCSVLSLGTRKDAATWKDRVHADLGYEVGLDVRDPAPARQRILDVFRRSDDWLFLGGHFQANRLYNENDSIGITFAADSLSLHYPGSADVVLRRGVEFQQHSRIKAVFWGGCDVCNPDERVVLLRKLFGPHILVGWIATTGWEILNTVMGAMNRPDAEPDFFDRMNVGGEVDIVSSWLAVANGVTWGAAVSGPAWKERFSVFDASGQEWVLRAGVVKKGRKL